MNYSVRRAKEKDIPFILELLVQVDMVHHNSRPDIFKGPVTKYTESELKEILNNNNTPVFVCVDNNDKPLGHAFCIKNEIKNHQLLSDIKTLYIDDICVDEKSRGNHIGKTLYDYVIDYAKENGFYNVTLNVWACNKNAVEFYKSLGMVTQKIGMEVIL